MRFPSALAADSAPERDQRSIDMLLQIVLIRSLAIGHLFAHVPPVARTFRRVVPPFLGKAALNQWYI